MLELEQARLKDTYLDTLTSLTVKTDLLAIEDFGLMELDLDKCRDLFEVIDGRDGRRSTIDFCEASGMALGSEGRRQVHVAYEKGTKHRALRFDAWAFSANARTSERGIEVRPCLFAREKRKSNGKHQRFSFAYTG